jgi:hypothetical protein
VVALLLLMAATVPSPALAQAASQAAATAAAPSDQAPVFKDEELDQMLAPIALYPDSLLSQVLMASTYPADVKDAAAWSKAHPDEKGDAAVAKVQDQPWEPAVQSLVAFPQVLAMMDARPDDVQKLGDAFLADPGRVMDRVQILRKKAQDAGNLKSNDQQKVTTTTADSKQAIVIEPAQPQTVYVPVYQPTVVYGAWPYPTYPPYYWPPPPYYYRPGATFVAGVIWGAAIVGISNSLWGGFHWGHHDVNINVNRYNNININRRITSNNTSFNFNPDRRRNVPYRDNRSREKYAGRQLDGAKDREAFRGKDNRSAQRSEAAAALKARGADPAAGREKLQGVDREKAARAARDTKLADGPRQRPSTQPGRAGAGAGGLSGAGDRAGRTGAGSSAFAGARDSGASRASADRGRASRQSMGSHAGAANRAAPSRARGGANRAAPSRAGGGRRR